MHQRYEIAFSTPAPVPTLELHQLIGKYVPGYSLVVGEGAWEGTIEHSYLVSTVSHAGDNAITDLAETLRDTYQQQCVLVTSWDVNADMI